MRNKLQLTILVIALLFITASSSGGTKPNIVLILADDWGWTDWEGGGSKFYETPYINQLASEGMQFTQAYAHPLCSPSRAALMTGKYPGARFGMFQAITGKSVLNPTVPEECNESMPVCWPTTRNHMPLEEITIAEELRAAGYLTLHFGKWHMGNRNFYPVKQGFDNQFAVGGAGPGRGGYFAPYEGLDNIEQGPDGEYIAERLTSEVCKALEEHKDTNFFIYLSHYNVHAPYQAKKDLQAYYQEKADKNPNNKQRHPAMGAMIHSLDSSVGQINEKIKFLGLEDNTIVILVGDNGGIHWKNDKYLKDIPVTSNYPLRSGKACFYEGGIRVPCMVKFPKHIQKGTKSKTPVHLIDFYPTLLDFAHVKPSAEKGIIDGKSIKPILLNQGEMEDRPIFCHFPRKKQMELPSGGSYVRSGDYKLCLFYNYNGDGKRTTELFNIKYDIGEKADSSAFLTEIHDSLQVVLNNWLAETGALIPKPNPNYHE